jgi:hypothetical protein
LLPFLRCIAIIVNRINTIENVIIDTKSFSTIVPIKNEFDNAADKDKLPTTLFVDGINSIIKNTTKEITAAIIWLSVILDANIPNAIYAIDIKVIPNSETKNDGICGSPKKVNIIK